MKIQPAERIQNVKQYYFAHKLEEIRHKKKQGDDVLNIAIGNPDIPPPDNVIEKLQQSASHDDVHGYQSYKGDETLRQAYAQWYSRFFNVNLDPETEILPSMGAKEAIMHISMAFLDKGDKVLVPDPGYPTYSKVSNLVQAEIVPYNLTQENGWLPDITDLEIKNPDQVKLMWINYPHMPTGGTATKKSFQQLINFAKRHNILLINDNPYSLVLNDNPLSILNVADNEAPVLELNSLSKSHNMAGWRIGVIAGDSTLLEQIMKIKSNINSGMFLPLQLAAAEALKQDEEWYRQLNERYKKRRESIYEILDKLQCSYQRDMPGMFVWGKVPESFESGEQLSDHLLYDKHIFVAPGFIFGENGTQHIRISLSNHESTLQKAYERVNT